jgi:hypothetical protein
VITLDQRPGEPLTAYLTRCLETAKRTHTDVCVSWRGTVAIVTPRSTVEVIAKELQPTLS